MRGVCSGPTWHARERIGEPHIAFHRHRLQESQGEFPALRLLDDQVRFCRLVQRRAARCPD